MHAASTLWVPSVLKQLFAVVRDNDFTNKPQHEERAPAALASAASVRTVRCPWQV